MYDNNTFDNKTITVQGFGNVSYIMVRNIFERNLNVKEINVYDITSQKDINMKIDKIKKDFPNSNIKLNGHSIDINDNSFIFDKCDIFSPCATGGILNNQTIPKLNCKYIVGAANNQLQKIKKTKKKKN